jgi:TRAP-type mannitol/chloroaromatic compound transport system permease large subunit
VTFEWIEICLIALRGISMPDVYRGMWPFVALHVLGLILCIAFSEIVLWLPRITGLLD